MLLEIFHRISGKTHRVVRAPALGFRGTHKLALEVRRSARCYERRSYRDFATKLQAVDRDRVNLGNVGFGVPVLRRTIGINRSEEPTSELQSLLRISYAVFCLK